MTKSVLNKHKAERFCATSGSGVGLTENWKNTLVS